MGNLLSIGNKILWFTKPMKTIKISPQRTIMLSQYFCKRLSRKNCLRIYYKHFIISSLSCGLFHKKSQVEIFLKSFLNSNFNQSDHFKLKLWPKTQWIEENLNLRVFYETRSWRCHFLCRLSLWLFFDCCLDFNDFVILLFSFSFKKSFTVQFKITKFCTKMLWIKQILPDFY